LPEIILPVLLATQGRGLGANDGEEPAEFAIVREDKKFVWTKAGIEGDKIVLCDEDEVNPMYVRYAWIDNTLKHRFFNKEGLPAFPFKSDK
jgi:sialate O-acetylesterase